MISIAICDDSSGDIKILKEQLSSLSDFDLNVKICVFEDPCEFVETIKRGYRFNLILMDMLMKPINGIEASKQIREYDPNVPLIIITSTSEFAVDGYKVDALRYLIKPVDKDELIKLVLPILKHNLFLNQQFFTFLSSEGFGRIPVSDILYFKSNLREITLVGENGEKHRFTGKISEISKEVESFDFIRIHKSFVVNLHKIEAVNSDNLRLSSGAVLPLSKHRHKEILLKYMDIMNAFTED